MKPAAANLQCPACQHPLRPVVLGCNACGIRVEGPFELNEFATLSGEDLHLLRIFVLSEGRIRDMEAPLGLSYPTIRSRLKALRAKIASRASDTPTAGRPAETHAGSARSDAASEVLAKLETGKITFEEAMRLIKANRS